VLEIKEGGRAGSPRLVRLNRYRLPYKRFSRRSSLVLISSPSLPRPDQTRSAWRVTQPDPVSRHIPTKRVDGVMLDSHHRQVTKTHAPPKQPGSLAASPPRRAPPGMSANDDVPYAASRYSLEPNPRLIPLIVTSSSSDLNKQAV